jgi:hypothetical protein
MVRKLSQVCSKSSITKLDRQARDTKLEEPKEA